MGEEIDEGAVGFLEYQTGLSSRMGEKVGGSSMRAVQCKLGHYRSFTGVEHEKREWKGEWGREGREGEGEGPVVSRLCTEWWNESARNLRSSLRRVRCVRIVSVTRWRGQGGVSGGSGE